jgi:NAD(P)-dependent dehydrogenase (short-subunit alcohol dehydrogenase family)
MSNQWSVENIPNQKGKNIIITGANSGIGYEAAKILAKNDANIIMACRDLSRAQKAKDEIIKEYPDASISLYELDLSSLKSVDKFIKDIKSDYEKIDILLNNAGVMAPPYSQTDEGLELQFGVNHIGHFSLTLQLLDLFKTSADPRIVNVASLAHKFGNIKPSTFYYRPSNKYKKNRAYAQSKLANLLFTYGLDRRLKQRDSQIKVIAAHPGVSSTNLGRHSKLLSLRGIRSIVKTFNQSSYMGSLPSVRACTDPNAKSGEYYGPSKFFEFKGNPIVVNSTKRAQDKELQQLLWDESVRITNKKLDASI